MMRDYAGVLALSVVHLGLGAAVLYGLGLARAWRAQLSYAGLSLVVGWVLLGIASSFALVAGLALTVPELLVLAFVLAGCALLLSRRVAPAVVGSGAPAAAAWLNWVAVAGAALLFVYVEALFRRAKVEQPHDWDVWAFWLPKAKSIVYFGGLDTGVGGYTSFANPDYPPLVPASEAGVFRFVGSADPRALPLQHWVLAVAFFGALAALLARRVPQWIVWPSLAMLAVLPTYTRFVGSSLAEEPLVLIVGVATVCGALWMLEGEARLGVLCGILLAGEALAKNEGLVFAVLVALVIGLARSAAWPRRLASTALLAAAPILAVVPWRLWMQAHHVPPTAAYRFGDLFRPSYLADRVDRLGIAFERLPGFVFAWDRWLLTVPVAIALALIVARRRPPLSALLLVGLVVGFLGNAVTYWISTFPLDWYISTSAARTTATLVIFAAVLLPLLAAEAFAPEPDASG